MSTTAATPLLRWSSVRDCPRKGIYESEGAPARERTPSEEGTLWRGKSIGRDYAIFLATEQKTTIHVESGPDYWVPPELRAATADDAGLIAEQRIKWPFGIGHQDLYVKETATIIEVLSSAHASEQMKRAKMLQGIGYVEHHPHAENLALIVVSPTDLTMERTIVMPGTRLYEELREEMRERIAELERWRDDGEMPARVCSKPSEARGHFCMFAQHCFQDWEPPPLEEIAADGDLLEAVGRFVEVKRARAELASRDKALEIEQKEAQAVMDAAELPAGQQVIVGPFEVRRTQVERQPTFEWAKAESAGVFEPGLYGEFFKAGRVVLDVQGRAGGYERGRVRRGTFLMGRESLFAARYHPDPEVNEELVALALENERVDLAAGFPPKFWRCECGAGHSRGHFQIVGVHRCMWCGYVGTGGTMHTHDAKGRLIA